MADKVYKGLTGREFVTHTRNVFPGGAERAIGAEMATTGLFVAQ
jgi:hypothetical protein